MSWSFSPQIWGKFYEVKFERFLLKFSKRSAKKSRRFVISFFPSLVLKVNFYALTPGD